MCAPLEKTHASPFLLPTFNHFLYDMLAHCTVAPYCSWGLFFVLFLDVILAPIHTTPFFTLCNCLPFQKYEHKQKGYICKGSGRNTWVTAPSWGQGELEGGSAIREGVLWPDPAQGLHYNTHWTLQQGTGPECTQILLSWPFPYHMEWLSNPAAISTTLSFVHIVRFNPLLLLLFPSHHVQTKKNKKTIRLQHRLQRSAQGSDCSLHAAAKTARASCSFLSKEGKEGERDCHCEHRVNMENEGTRWRDCWWVRQVPWIS